MDLVTRIAKAIKEIDKTYFFENYTKQAEHVIRSLRGAGYTILPDELTPEMEQAGIEAIKYGPTRSRDLVKEIYHNMIEVAEIQVMQERTEKMERG